MSYALALENVSKNFWDKIAVNDLTLRLEEGSFIGLLV